MNLDWPCLSARAEGSLLRLAVVPGASRTCSDGLHDGCLRVRLAAPPVEGRANTALLAWLADELRLPRRSVRLRRGDSSRRKQVELDAPVGVVADWLSELTAPGTAAR